MCSFRISCSLDGMRNRNVTGTVPAYVSANVQRTGLPPSSSLRKVSIDTSLSYAVSLEKNARELARG